MSLKAIMSIKKNNNNSALIKEKKEKDSFIRSTDLLRSLNNNNCTGCRQTGQESNLESSETYSFMYPGLQRLIKVSRSQEKVELFKRIYLKHKPILRGKKLNPYLTTHTKWIKDQCERQKGLKLIEIMEIHIYEKRLLTFSKIYIHGKFGSMKIKDVNSKM